MIDLISVAFLTGFVGDAITQFSINNLGFDMGLKNYFKKQGRVEALFIGGAIVALAYILYIHVLNLPLTYTNLFIYGIVLDFIFRYTRFFPSLNEYYDKLSIPQTAIIGGSIPAMLPLFIYKNFAA
jgi:hypothetical protein